MNSIRQEQILILCKTYPSPSGKHAETSCVAGVTKSGELIRLFPVPFRLIKDDQKFKKWQWINAKVYKAKDDRRPESHKIYVDTISLSSSVDTKRDWRVRRALMAGHRVHSDFALIEEDRLDAGSTLAFLRPRRLIDLQITPVDDVVWTQKELGNLLQKQQQGGLFDNEDAPQIRTLRKLPYSFHYNYECEHDGELRTYRHKIADWETGALFWRCKRDYGDGWEQPFRQRLEAFMSARDLIFLMGTIHRFPDQWLIISLIYPPRRSQQEAAQAQLL